MKICKAFELKGNNLISVGEFCEYEGLLNENKHKNIKITKSCGVVNKNLDYHSKRVDMHTGKLFVICFKDVRDIFVAWHILDYDEDIINEKVIFNLMTKELKDELKKLYKSLTINKFNK